MHCTRKASDIACTTGIYQEHLISFSLGFTQSALSTDVSGIVTLDAPMRQCLRPTLTIGIRSLIPISSGINAIAQRYWQMVGELQLCGNAHSVMKKPRMSHQRLESGFTGLVQDSIQISYQADEFKVVGKKRREFSLLSYYLFNLGIFALAQLACTKIHEISFVVNFYKGDIGSTIIFQVATINELS